MMIPFHCKASKRKFFPSINPTPERNNAMPMKTFFLSSEIKQQMMKLSSQAEIDEALGLLGLRCSLLEGMKPEKPGINELAFLDQFNPLPAVLKKEVLKLKTSEEFAEYFDLLAWRYPMLPPKNRLDLFSPENLGLNDP